MSIGVMIIVLSIMGGIGAVFYEKPTCENLQRTEYVDEDGWKHIGYECIDKR